MESNIRLQKYIASCTGFSRRKAEEFIDNGRIKINGKKVNTQGIKIDPLKDIVEFDCKRITSDEEKIYVILNKPAGYLSTKSDTHDRETVMDLIPYKNIYPVGRLDKETSGLLILTNDGDLAFRVTHPKFEHEKEYIVHSKYPLSTEDKEKLEKGIVIEGSKTAPCKINNIQNEKGYTSCHVIIHEGKKRQIRIMFEDIRNSVVYLKRIRIGKLLLGTLPKGAYKIITKETAQKAIKM